MRLKIVVVDFEIPPKLKRFLVHAAVPIVALGTAGIAFAAPALRNWRTGDTLTAEDLNANFKTMDDRISSLESTSAAVGWGQLHTAAAAACLSLTPVQAGSQPGLVLPKANGISCTKTCSEQVSGNQKCAAEVAVGLITAQKAVDQKPVAKNYLYYCDNAQGSASEVGARDLNDFFSYCCCVGP